MICFHYIWNQTINLNRNPYYPNISTHISLHSKLHCAAQYQNTSKRYISKWKLQARFKTLPRSMASLYMYGVYHIEINPHTCIGNTDLDQSQSGRKVWLLKTMFYMCVFILTILSLSPGSQNVAYTISITIWAQHYTSATLVWLLHVAVQNKYVYIQYTCTTQIHLYMTVYKIDNYVYMQWTYATQI